MRVTRIVAVGAAVLLAAGGVWAGCGKCEAGAKVDKPGCAGGACAVTAKTADAAHTAGPAAVDPSAIGRDALAALVRAGTGVTILDARTGKYDDGRRIPGAKALSPEAKAEDAAAVIKDKNTLVVTYCANLQCPASGLLAKRLKELGYRNVVELPEGIQGWVEGGNPVEQARK
jgi:rhodanese-related sulfurtransferase